MGSRIAGSDPTQAGHEAQDFLAALADPGSAIDASHVAIVVAHPDDETIGLGGQIGRLAGATLIHVTDGAPRDMLDATTHGFASREDYAAARAGELAAAMAQTGMPPSRLVSLGAADQESARAMPALVRRLAGILAERAVSVVLTHAYEGGHPDHDAAAFITHAACRAMAGRRPLIVEMPFYHAENGAMVAQTFAPGRGAAEIVLPLGPDAWDIKRRMLDAHATQARTLAAFTAREERFRAAPSYDFRQLPNGGALLYERFSWGLMGREWQRLVHEALADLGGDAWP